MKKGDIVKIVTGKDKGKTGKIIRVDKKLGKIAVEGMNMYKKHSRPKREGEKGEVVTVTRAFDISNAMIVCNSCNKPVREAYKRDEGKSTRYCRKCNTTL